VLDAILTGDDVLVDDHFVGLCLRVSGGNQRWLWPDRGLSWKRPSFRLSILYMRWETLAPSNGITWNHSVHRYCEFSKTFVSLVDWFPLNDITILDIGKLQF